MSKGDKYLGPDGTTYIFLCYHNNTYYFLNNNQNVIPVTMQNIKKYKHKKLLSEIPIGGKFHFGAGGEYIRLQTSGILIDQGGLKYNYIYLDDNDVRGLFDNCEVFDL